MCRDIEGERVMKGQGNSPLDRDFPDDCSLTTAASSFRDFTSLWRFDKQPPGIPSFCGTI